MQIRSVEKGEEYCYTDDGYEICCPICGTAWLEEVEGEFNIDSCEHLRFSLHSDNGDDFDIFGKWDSVGFLKLVEKVREEDENYSMDILEILELVQHPDVDMAMIYVWQHNYRFLKLYRYHFFVVGFYSYTITSNHTCQSG